MSTRTHARATKERILARIFGSPVCDGGEHYAYEPHPYSQEDATRLFIIAQWDAPHDDFAYILCLRHGIGCVAQPMMAIVLMNECDNPFAPFLVKLWKDVDG